MCFSLILVVVLDVLFKSVPFSSCAFITFERMESADQAVAEVCMITVAY